VRPASLLPLALLVACSPVESDPDATPPPVDGAPDAPPGVEACTPQTAGAVPGDEDGDGLVDEGCAWSFGVPHPLSAPMGVAWVPNIVTPTWISHDGRRLYVTYATTFGQHTGLYVVSRPDRSARFGAPTPVAGIDLANYSVNGFTVSSDEREAYFTATTTGSMGSDVYRATRASIDEPFGALVALPALSTANNDERPALSVDGRELWLAHDRRLVRSTRTATSEPFGPPEALRGLPDIESNAVAPSIDGRTIFYYVNASGRFQLMRAERADGTTATFGDPVEVVALEPSGMYENFLPVLSQSTQEMFFGSNQPWSPTHYAIWRARICRDGACPSEPIACPSGTGVRSPDGLHCYSKLTTAQTQTAAETACAQQGGHLAAINSAAEQALVWDRFGTESLWMGGFDDARGVGECNTLARDGSPAFPCPWGWTSGEVWTYANWGATPSGSVVEPEEGGEQDCGVLWFDSGYDGKWADELCGAAHAALCETVSYPTW
jgi:hypothetical protein